MNSVVAVRRCCFYVDVVPVIRCRCEMLVLLLLLLLALEDTVGTTPARLLPPLPPPPHPRRRPPPPGQAQECADLSLDITDNYESLSKPPCCERPVQQAEAEPNHAYCYARLRAGCW